MGIVDAERLNRHMSAPQWKDEQWAEAEDVCDMVEGDLAAWLNNPIAPDTANPVTETVAVTDSGLVAAYYIIYAVTNLNGTVIATGAPLPDGWILRNGRLRQTTSAVGAPVTISSLTSFAGPATRVQGFGQVTLTYVPGWGDQPALRQAILTRAAAIMDNRYSDTLIARDLSGDQPQRIPEQWTQADLDKLGRFRNLAAWR